jgi:hypothetical protein
MVTDLAKEYERLTKLGVAFPTKPTKQDRPPSRCSTTPAAISSSSSSRKVGIGERLFGLS